MRHVLASLLAASVLLAGAARAAERRVVVELFTSQGCPSCPPADEFLRSLAARDDVLALSLHVDYWDYMGWKDTFASPENTARQRGYAAAGERKMVYTPQMVINGADHVVGTRFRDISALTIDDAEEAGGKGANMGELVAAGLPVPPGFVLLRDCYRDSMSAGGVAADLSALHREALDTGSDTGRLNQLCEQMQSLVQKAGVDDAVRDLVLGAYRELAAAAGGEVVVAVRSSATGEDGADASFAGMNATITNVAGEENLLEAVNRCWMSLFSPRVITYRATRGFTADPAMAVPPAAYVRVHLRPKAVAAMPLEIRAVCGARHADFVICAKPAGVPTHAAMDNASQNALSALSAQLGARLLPTSRLDVPTSGLLCFARTAAFQSHFNAARRRRLDRQRERLGDEHAGLVHRRGDVDGAVLDRLRRRGRCGPSGRVRRFAAGGQRREGQCEQRCVHE